MLRSISLKLMLAFGLVSLTSILLMGWLVRVQTEPGIAEFNTNTRQRLFIESAENWYEQNGSWDGINRAISSARDQDDEDFRGLGRGVLLTDDKFIVVFGRLGQYDPGDRLRTPDRQRSRPIMLEDQVIGHVIFQTPNGGPPRGDGSPEDVFRQQFERALLLGAGWAIVIALAAGGILAGTLSRPLRQLTTATQALADGNLGQQVNIKSGDEIGQLGQAFNSMSHDLAEGERQRQQMTADIAHDLRTPLSVILGYTEALSDGKLDGDSEIYDAMHHEATQLNRLIDDLRTLSLADAGKLSLHKINVPIDEILQQASNTWRMAASGQNIELTTTVDQPFELMVDSGRLLQALGNLISNALRYTQSGGAIRLTARQDGEHGVIQVSDTGDGISADKLSHIFDRFYRADDARQTQSGQSGLGLAIVKSLVEAHSGTITAESVVGEGTAFTIRLPL